MVEEIRSHPLARGLTATAVRRHARELRAAGWTPDDVARELAAQNFTGARSAGLLRYRRTALAQSGPTPPPAPRAADRPATTTRDLVARDDAAHAAAPPSPETLAAARAAAWRAPPADHTHERTTAMTTTATPRPTTAARINPDNRLVLAGLLVVLVAVAAASFTLSFTGLSAAAPWAAIPVRLAWLVPVALEVAMLGYVIAAFVRTHRGQSARLPWTLVRALTTVSSAINAAHAWDAGPKGWQGIVGAALAAGFPFMTLAAAHVVAGVALGRSRTPPPRRTRTPRPRPTRTPRRGTRTPRRSPRAPETPAAVGALAPVAVVVERAPALRAVDTEATDTAADGGHLDGVRSIRTAARRRVAERLDEIDRLAQTTDLSGRAIADALGLGRTSVCARVSAVQAGRTDTRTPDTDAVLLAV
ncbi:DUF2637 domain-containing protein [Cellulosimicrobium aquatile]|uniref:DUF2637 domain-containing protein n=1 Tax=Cellulosimicrobium aquatile TaxID=1612203 RepID=UPI0014598406|nr:DUF2637 domain-containing protein [Cellulosimicrobium aquatile]